MRPVIQARGLTKQFTLRHNRTGELKSRFLSLIHPARRERREAFLALKGIDLTIGRGEALGLVGRNGSGKSTFMKLVAGIHRPSGGQLLVAAGARIGSMIELGIGFHPELTGEENVYINTSIHGLDRGETDAIYEAIVDYSGLRHFMDVPLKNYSSGMHMRLGFAIAAQLDPDIMLLDEIFAVGDEDFQKQCIRTLEGFLGDGRTILFVSHSAAAIRTVCSRVVVLDDGRLAFDGDVDGGLGHYRELVATRRDADVRGSVIESAPPVGMDPDLAWHRLAAGGDWAREGEWVVDALRRHGLRADHVVLEVGCGSLSAGRHLLEYMDEGHYWGFERDRELLDAGIQAELPRTGVAAERGHYLVNDRFDFSAMPARFDLVIASSQVRRMTLNSVARMAASVLHRLAPGGRFIMTWPDNPDPDNFEPVERSDGTLTYPDREPFHYPFDVLAGLLDVMGGRAVRVEDESHPRGESVMVITRNE